MSVPKHSSKCSFKRVSLKGRNTGATMITRRTTSGRLSQEQEQCCSINIYVNNNIQGVNNSVLVGSAVKLTDPGVYLCVGHVDAMSRYRSVVGVTVGFGLLGILLLVLIFVVLVVVIT